MTATQQADFKLIRNADIEVKQIINSKKRNEAEITINGEFQHRFSDKSRVSKHLDVMSPKDLQERMQGGAFFMVDDQLVDWRDGHYAESGFIHTDEHLGKMMEILGYQTAAEQPWHRGGRGDVVESQLRSVLSQ